VRGTAAIDHQVRGVEFDPAQLQAAASSSGGSGGGGRRQDDIGKAVEPIYLIFQVAAGRIPRKRRDIERERTNKGGGGRERDGWTYLKKVHIMEGTLNGSVLHAPKP
jgi:hypothetical protein